MSLIKQLFKTLFGKNNERVNSKNSNDNSMFKWETKREKEIKETENRIKEWLIVSLKDKGQFSFSWESGSDEAFLTFEHSTDENEENIQELEEYILDKLDIPDAGEFKMNGKGFLYMEGNLVKAKYSSTMKEIIDYNEETDEEIYSEEEEKDSDDRVLFSV